MKRVPVFSFGDEAMLKSIEDGEPTLSAATGTNADLIAKIFALYVPAGGVVVDPTYGRGVMWQKIDRSRYTVLATDLQDGTDFKALPYEDDSADAFLLDPPYAHGGATLKESINKCYRNENSSHESVIRLYAAGILEAARILKKRGTIVIKCQDEIESKKQRWSHVEILTLLQLFGFETVDLFVLVQLNQPALRYSPKEQQSARKNHSYAIVGRLVR